MKISTKGRYALRMLLELAENREAGYLSLKEIAARQDISKKYLEQIVGLLNSSGLLKTNRGLLGGYMLAVPPEQCSVGQVLRLTEGSIHPVACLENSAESCARGSFCKTLPVWKNLDKLIADYLDSVSLQDILDNAKGNGCDSTAEKQEGLLDLSSLCFKADLSKTDYS